MESSWPPQDPDYDTEHKLQLPDSPWTYENGTVNPNLRPSNSQLQRSNFKRRRPGQQRVSPVPPYHPDYQADDEYTSPISQGQLSRIRRGSEGYEIRPIGREEMLQQHLQELGEERDKYIRYIPEPDLDSESEDDLMISQYSTDTPDATGI